MIKGGFLVVILCAAALPLVAEVSINSPWEAYLENVDSRKDFVRNEMEAGRYPTVDDMMTFCQMLANDGKAPDGTRILSHAPILELFRTPYPGGRDSGTLIFRKESMRKGLSLMESGAI